MPNTQLDVKSLGPISGARVDQPVNVRLDTYPNSYDANYRPEYVQEYNRAANQSGLEQIWHGLASRTLSIIPKVGQGLGALYGAFSSIGEDDISKIWDNPISNAMNNLDDSIRDSLPVYQSRKYANSGLWGKMGTTSFWANDAFDGIAYAASAFVPGTVIGKGLSWLGKGIEATSTGAKILEGLSAIGATEHRANLLLSTAYNTISEAAVEAYQTQQEIQASLVAKGMPEQEAKQKASEAAARTFRANTVVLAVPNLVENMLFHGGWEDLQKSVRSAVWNAGAEGTKAAEAAAKIDSVWKKVGLGVGTEGFWEENVQTSIQQYERMAANNPDNDKGYVSTIAQNMGNNVAGFFKSFMPGQHTNMDETEGAVSIFLGGLIGGLSGVYSYGSEKSDKQKLVKQEEARYKELFGDIGNAATFIMRDNAASLYKKDGKIKVGEQEVDDFKLDANGNPIMDDGAILNLTMNQLRNKHLWDAQTIAAYRNDPALNEMNKQVALASYVFSLMNNKNSYTADEVGKYLDNFAKVGNETAKQLGVETEINSNIALAKQYANDLQAINTKHSSAKDNKEDPSKSKFNSFLTRTEFYLNARKKALENIATQTTTPAGSDTVNKLLEDTNTYLRQIREEKPALYNEYKKSVFDRNQTYAQYKSLTNKANRTADETSEMQKLDYLLREDAYINGAWAGSDSSSDLTPSLSLSQASKIRPGSKDIYNRELGNSVITLDRLDEAIDDPNNSVIESARQFASNVTVVPDDYKVKANAVKDKLTSKLDNLSSSNKDSAEGLTIVDAGVGGLLDEANIGHDETYALDVLLNSISEATGIDLVPADATVDEVMANPNVQGMLKVLSDAGVQIDGNTLFDNNFISNNELALSNLSQQTKNNLQIVSETSTALDSLNEAVNTMSGVTRLREKLDKFAAAPNKSRFLVEDFYNSSIKEPVEAYIKAFDPETIDDDLEYQDYENTLVKAQAAFKDRKFPKIEEAVQEMLDILRNKIYPAIVTNSSKRAERHRVINNNLVHNFHTSLFKSAPIRELVETIIGKDKVASILERTIEDQDVLSYDGSMELAIQLSKSATPEQMETLVDLLKKQRHEISERFLDTISIVPRTITNLRRSAAFENNPYYNTLYLLGKYFEDDMPPVIRRFLNDHDFEALELSLRTASIPESDKEFLRSLKKAFDSIVAINAFNKALEVGPLSFAQLLTEAKDRLSQSPSLQQNIVLTQALHFLYSVPNGTRAMNNWLLVRGIGGSGKTFLIANTLIELHKQLEGAPQRIYAFSKEKLTSDNINNAIFGDNRSNASYEAFMSKTAEEVAALDYIVIDEVFTFTNAEIANINSKIAEAYQINNKLLKVIALGDPSQLTAEEESNVTTALGTNMTMPLTTSYRTNVNSIASFTRKFQLNTNRVNSPLVVASVSVEDAVKDPSDAYGVMGGSAKDLEDILLTPSTRTRALLVNSALEVDALKNKFPGVAVKTVRQAQGYQWDEVYTLLDPTELGADDFEVNRALYTAFSRAKSFLFVGGDYVVNSSPNSELKSGINNSANELDEAAAMFKANIELAKSTKDILNGVPVFTQEDLIPQEVSDDTLGQTDEGIVNSPSYSETPEPVQSKIVEEPISTTGQVFLSYPSNYALNDVRQPNGVVTSKVGIGKEAHILKTSGDSPKYYVVTENVLRKGKYVVIGVLGNEDFEGKAGEFFNQVIKNTASPIDENFLTTNPEFDLPNISAVSLGAVKISDYQKFRTVTDPTNYISESSQFVPGATDVIEDAIIRFYNSYYGVTASGKVLSQTNVPERRWVVDGKVNWKAIGDNVEIQIFDKKKDTSKDIVPANFSVSYGVPYLVIKAPEMETKDGSKASKRNVLIKMQPRKFSRRSASYATLREFYNAVKVVEEATNLQLGSVEFGDLVRDYASTNFKVDKSITVTKHGKPHHRVRMIDNPKSLSDFGIDIDDTFASKVTDALITIVHGVFDSSNNIKYFDSEEEALSYAKNNGVPKDGTEYHILNDTLVVGAAPTNSKKWTLQISQNPQDPEIDTVPYREWKLEEGSGNAQLAFNNLAKANATISDQQLRQTQTKVNTRTGETEFKFLRAPSLLTYYHTTEAGEEVPRVYTDYEAFYQDPEIIRLLGDQSFSNAKRSYSQLLDMLDKALQQDEKTGISQRVKAKAMVDAYTTSPVTSDFLSLIVGHNVFNNQGEHEVEGTYLREPLVMHNSERTGVNDLGKGLSNELTRLQLASKLRHDFVGFEKTHIAFANPVGTITVTPPGPRIVPKTKTIGEVISKIPISGIPTFDRVLELVRSLPIQDTKIIVYPNGIPIEGTPENILQPDGTYKLVTPITFFKPDNTHVHAAGQDSDDSWFIGTTLGFDNVANDRRLASSFLHESIHIATKAALQKGLKDLQGKRKDTKEAILYKRIATLKRRFDGAVKSKINPATGARYKLSEVYTTTASPLDINEFVANLSHAPFVELASQITALPKGSRKSILRELIESILNAFKSILGIDANVFESTVVALEDFFKNTASPSSTKIIVVTSAGKEEFIEKLNAALSVEDEFAFQANRDFILSQYAHIIDKSTVPQGPGERVSLKTRKDFDNLTAAEQQSIISSVGDFLHNLSFAYYNLPSDQSQATVGSIITTKGLSSFVDRLFKDAELSKEEKNLLKTIVFKQISNPASNIVERLINSDAASARDILYQDILSDTDKTTFRIATNSLTDAEASSKIFDTEVGQSVAKIISLLSSELPKLQTIIGSAEDRSSSRYQFAKDFIIKFINNNLDKDKGGNEIIKTREEVISDLQTLVASPKLALSNGMSMVEASKALNAYYEELTTIKSKKVLSPIDSKRYNDLVFITIPNMEDELAALASLRETNSRTGNKLLLEILKDIYPKYSFSAEEDLEIAMELQELAEAGYSAKDRIDDELAEFANISEYMDNYSKSYELTLSESIKDFLIGIRVGDRIISPNLAYIKTLQLATSLDWTQPLTNNESKRGIIQQLAAKRSELSESSDLDIAIIDNFISIVNHGISNNYLDGVSIDPGIGITTVKSPTGITLYSAYINNDPSLPATVFTYPETQALSGVNPLIDSSKPFAKTADLYQWLLSNNPTITIPQFNRMFTKAEAINGLRGIMNTMGSMKETELFIGTRQLRNGNEFRMVRSTSSGIAYTIKDQIVFTLSKLHENDKLKGFSTYFRNKNINGRSLGSMATGTYLDQEFFVRQFFAEMGFGSISDSMTIPNVSDWVNDILGFMERTSVVAPYSTEVLSSEEVGDDAAVAANEYEFRDWVNNYVDGYLSKFSTLLSKSDDLFRNPSVRDSKGNKFYKFHESSWAYDSLLNLIDMSRNKFYQGTNGNNKMRRVPEYLLTNFYDHNIFVRGEIFNRIYSIGEYEAAKNLDNGSVTPYTRENLYFFFQRKFIQGFLDGIRQFDNSYYQFTYIPSDKPKHPLVRVGILSDNNKGGTSPIELAVHQVLKQILERSTAKEVDITNYDKSISKDRFRNFNIGQKALDNLKVELNEKNIPAIASEVMRLMEEEASKLLDTLTSDDVRLSFDKNTYSTTRRLKDKLNSKFPLNETNYASSSKSNDELFRNRVDGKYGVNKADILPLFDLFFKNNYVNNYFLNQLVTGDYMAYKSSADIVKRFAGVFGPGIKPLVDPVVGMREKFKVLVLADTVENKEPMRQRFINLLYRGEEPTGEELKEFDRLMSFFGDSFESTDAQGFILPKRYAQLSRGFEKSWSLGQVHKPIYFGVHPHQTSEGYTTAVPTYLKYSAVVLDDAIVSKFPALRKLRDNAEKMGVDEIVFNSAVKEGMVRVKDENGETRDSLSFEELTSMDNAAINNVRDNYKVSPILELDNRNYRFQFNASANPNKKIALYTQLMYFLNVYPDSLSNGTYATTQDAAKNAYQLVADLIKYGRENLVSQLDSQNFETLLMKNLSGPGSERALEMLHAGISANHPLLEKKGVIALASAIEKATIKIKFPGGKLVLQTAEGIDLYQDPTLYKDLDPTKARDLRYQLEDIEYTSIDGTTKKKSMMVAEAIVPREILTSEQLRALSEGKSIYLLPDALAFRIPSTELHSAVPLRIVGIYSNKLSNVIIGPKDLVPIHGSDFDVDALFVITREVYSKSETLVLRPQFITGYLDSIKKTFEELRRAEASLSVEDVPKIRSLKEDIKRFVGLLNTTDDIEVNQSDVESQFKDFVDKPQLMANSNKFTIVRSTLPNYDENRARAEWGAAKGYYYIDNQWVLGNSSAANAQKMLTRINEFIDQNPQLEKLAGILTTISSDLVEATSISNMRLIGERDAPVGYSTVSVGGENKYIIDPEYGKLINQEIEELTTLLNNLQSELLPVFSKDIKNSLRTLTSLREKYLKNRITDTMLEVISDDSNKKRIVSGITFKPLLDAIDNNSVIPSSLQPKTSFDLSNLADEFEVYSSLNAGMVLTGAFANASKSFGYFARAGATPELQELYDHIGGIKLLIKTLENNIPIDNLSDVIDDELQYASTFSNSIMKSEDPLETLNNILNALSKGRTKKYKRLHGSIDTSPKLNKIYRFNMQIGNNIYTFDTLSTIDVKGNYKVTEVYDSLTNAAIDNLKLGYLSRARINSNTGSVVIGLVSLGVPIDTIIKILYQPIFTPLVTGKVNNVSKWLEDLVRTHQSDILKESSTPLSETDLQNVIDSYPHLQGMPLDDIINKHPNLASTTLNALDVFSKGYKIGEDMRNTSNFLNILRQMDVFVEDILQLGDDLVNQIGTPKEINGELALMVRNDFSFLVPNLFESAPHIREAYSAHLDLVDLIQKNLLIHSKPIVDFSQEVSTNLPVFQSDRDEKAQAKLAAIRRGLSAYQLASMPIVQERLSKVLPRIIKTGGNKITLSVPRTFSDTVATRLWAIKEYEKRNSRPNLFLRNVSITTNELSVATIGFKAGVGLSSTDVQDIALGFKRLNIYTFDNEGNIAETIPPSPEYVSPFQQDLMVYAILNYGLQFSSSNFSNYILPRMLRTLDKDYVKSLLAIPSLPEEKHISLVNHFSLSYTLQNASKLPYIPFEFASPAEVTKNFNGDTIRIEPGMDTVNNSPVFFDLRFSKASNKGDEVLKAGPDFIKRDYKNRTEVLKKVLETESHVYYQRVGKLSDIYYSPYPTTNAYGEPITYDPINYYRPDEMTIHSHYLEDNTAFTFSKMTRLVKPGDKIYIVPNYNYDRAQRVFVEVKNVSQSGTGKVAGYKITFTKIEPELPSDSLSQAVKNLGDC